MTVPDSVSIVGGGIGGLSAACHLADAGADVTLFEQHDDLGGVAGSFASDGFRFDSGPSWYLMPEVFERFFESFGTSVDAAYELERLDPSYRVFWKDGDRLDVPADPDALAPKLEAYEDGAADAFHEYLDHAEAVYELAMDRFVYPRRARLRDWLDGDLLRAAWALPLLRSMDRHVGGYVEHPKLRQLLEYKLVFLGGSPYNTPALYTLMSHVDFNQGVFHPVGGMQVLVDALVDLADRLGVTLERNTPVSRIQPNGDGMRVRTNGDTQASDCVVANASPAHVERTLLPPDQRDHDDAHWDGQTYGPSAYLLYLGVEGDVGPLRHHSLVLPVDWDAHFETIFDEPGWPTDPAYYIHVPSKTDRSYAPDGHHSVFILVPIAPGLNDGPARRAWMRERVLEDLAEHAIDLRGRITVEHEACVSDFANHFGQPKGNALGLAHTLWQTGPLRPAHRADTAPGLYYTGADTQPGVGLPMCLISGKQTAQAIAADTPA
ncbi:phytoene desaturase [Salinibacter ruber]|uniref:phytoene desaturase family protein n=1 Tax=Salinibacter ruber TaxID=146919 RepID=UPI00207457F2|nr:phytoene desaturase family protein [Salinibacter ruber]MCS3828318.1 phytoene desaturase [Salinibacter ruber]MCS3955216.1 phytoene desaturase [Salinibacter ruber]MCS4055746.1 phytoene desaturase [Salinibacter ruber]MCS4059117.1 phytoene desaturase [Salinibacter ruber]MCS4098165.1 phytoene desaturase [Salinibacter ruber]